jgi:hypothetical protein
MRALIASRITVGVDAIAMRDHFGSVGVSFWWVVHHGEVWALSQL